MRIETPNSREQALTLVEVLVLTVVVAVLVGMVLPRLHPHPNHRPSCVNHLKQIGLAFRIFSTDNGGLFPMNVSTNQGGSRECVSGGNAFHHFQATSNELSTPMFLVCPQDKRLEATNWTMLSNQHVSYFVGFDAIEEDPTTILAGDRNLLLDGRRVAPGPLTLTTNSLLAWDKDMHRECGNILFGDGHVDQLSTARLLEQVRIMGTSTNRLLIP